jgi:hypothetical protein
LNDFFVALKKSDDLLNAADDDEEEEVARDEHCPPQGFHGERREMRDAIADNEPGMGGHGGEEEEATKESPERVRMLRAVVDHTRHFISMVKRPEWQIVALDIVARCVVLMETDK